MSELPRVLVVDDSAFARTVLSRLLRASRQLEVVGTARDGQDALDRIAELDPDLVTLDLTMPNVDGLGVLRALANRPRPRVVVVSMSTVETEVGAQALLLGAVALIAKPTALANDRLTEIGDQLVATLVAVGAGRGVASRLAAARDLATNAVSLVMIGTSTGGPQAISRLVTALPASFPVPVLIALHIPAGYTQAMAARLDRIAQMSVVEASDDLALEPGQVVLARGGSHLRVRRDGATLRAEVSQEPRRAFCPSVDELFMSGARVVGASAVGVILTGMGDDGLLGARALSEAHGALITEAESTCVVYGMPRVVDEAQLGSVSFPLDRIAAELVRRV